MKRIGIVVLATNAYFILGLRFMKRFMHFYEGDCEIVFYFFSNEDPAHYFNYERVKFYPQEHTNWRDGTNSKFKNIVNIQYDLKKEVDYVFYFDADTNIDKAFTEEWFLGDYVAGEHYGNRSWLANGAGFNRNPFSGYDYVSDQSPLPYTYRYGAFFGGTVDKMLEMCETLVKWQIIDTNAGYEPSNNDEGYLNAYFHNNTPSYTVPTEKFGFLISDKGGFEEIVRISDVNINDIKKELLENKEKLFNLIHKNIVYE